MASKLEAVDVKDSEKVEGLKSELSGQPGKERYLPVQVRVNGKYLLGKVILTDSEFASIKSTLSQREAHDNYVRSSKPKTVQSSEIRG
jgi:hypothetical protein